MLKRHRKRQRSNERAWQKIAAKLCDIACDSIMENPNDTESEEILKIIHPEGHRLAGYARFMSRGPRALIAGGAA